MQPVKNHLTFPKGNRVPHGYTGTTFLTLRGCVSGLFTRSAAEELIRSQRVWASFSIELSGYGQMNRYTQTCNEKKKKLL